MTGIAIPIRTKSLFLYRKEIRMATDNMQLTQLHPGVYSRIQSSDDTYQVSTGIITLFAADAFPKGKDNVVEFVGSVSEFVFKYGEPDFTRYGQQAYNIEHWLNSGGQAYVMRLLPDDATYAHAVLNIQSRFTENGKAVFLEDSGETVYVDNVDLRPTAAFVQENNKNLAVLQNELVVTRGNDQDTVDGMENNFILLVTPEGRGEFYNKLGFRITPNDSFNIDRSSQVYNFEVVQFDDEGDVSIVEGPYYVTFDTESYNGNSESMFIEDVVNRYSKYLKVEFNLNAYNRLAKQVNSSVRPSQLELLTGSTMEDPNTGKPMTSFNSKTNRNEDIHLAIQKYNSKGRPVLNNGLQEMNISTPHDSVQSAIVKLDNQLREADYDREATKMSYMKNFFPMLRADSFSQFESTVNLVLKTADNVKDDTGSLVKFMKDTFSMENTRSPYYIYRQAKVSYDKDKKQNDLTTMLSAADAMVNAVRGDFTEEATKLYAAYSLVSHGSSQGLEEANYKLHLPMMLNRINQRDKVSILAIEHEQKVANVLNKVQDYLLGIFEGSVVDNTESILNSIDVEVQYLHDNLLPAVFSSDISGWPVDIAKEFDTNDSDSVLSLLASAMATLYDLQSGYISQSRANPNYTTAILNTAKVLANRIIDVISAVNYRNNVDAIDDPDYGLYSILGYNVVGRSTKVPLYNDLRNFSKSAIDSITTSVVYTSEDVLKTGRNNIDNETSRLYQQNSLFFNNSLLDFKNPVKLLMGSDGSFTYDPNNLSDRATAIRQAIIRAYKGQVDVNVTNTKLIPFDVVLDARYPVEVKNAITTFVRDLRQDSQFFADTASPEFAVSPTDAVSWRKSKFNVISNLVSIFTQDFTYFDNYTGRPIRFSPAYVLAGKIPTNARQYGLQYPLAGPRRGIIDQFTDVPWYPNDAYKEQLYKARINYFEYDNGITKLGSQSTTQAGSGALSQINNNFTILRLRRGAEEIAANYIFELNTPETISSLYNALSAYTQQFIGDNSIQDVSIEISASDYDIQQRILRVNMSIKFNGVIERIALSFKV